MNLHAISYLNIGPFRDQTISIFFDMGKFLIKAPIGSGKSFLFFDGPMYGLYKYASRKMINMQSETGYIKLRFEVDGQHYLVTRNLKKGKKKDSCSSKLYIIKDAGKIKNSDTRSQSGIQKGTDIEDMFTGNIEEISFKNETDLQQTLSTLLPPREVFVSTIFLMQDADNIFELLPSERLSVLKDVFGLLGIDEAKDKIADKRRSLQTEIKIKSNSESYDSKLKHYLQDWILSYDSLKNLEILYNLVDWKIDEIQEIKNLADKLNIQNFSSTVLPDKIHFELEKIIDEKKTGYQSIKNTLEISQKAIDEIIVKTQKLTKEKEEKQSIIESLDEKIQKIDPEKLKSLQLAKQKIFEQEEALLKKIPVEQLESFLDIHKNTKILGEREGNNDFGNSISTANEFVDYGISSGKILREESNTLEAQKKQLEQKIAYQKERDLHYKKEIEKLKQKIKDFDAHIAEQEKFHCEKIDTHCPFIKQINKKSFEQLEQQKVILTKELEQLIFEFEEHKRRQQTENSQGEAEQSNILDQKLKELNELLENLKSFLDRIDWRAIKDLHRQNQTLAQEKRRLEADIAELEKEKSRLDEYKLQKEKLKSDLEHLSKQLEEQKNKQLVQTQEQDIIKKELEAQNPEQLLLAEQKHKHLEQSFSHITNLVDDYKTTQIELLKIKEEEKMFNNLYQIFSKELLLLVLEDSLPTLGEIINAFLGQVVDYQISFFLSKSTTDKLELEAKIYDEKGERDVKSLSGGQRTILKLVRMLAISSYMNSPMLFLDETINNLDQETVGKVADMLEDFVQKRDVKLYTVTHSQQIQDMDIWDKVLEIG